MLKELLEYIVDNFGDNEEAKTVHSCGAERTTSKHLRIIDSPTVKPLKMHSLTGLVEFINDFDNRFIVCVNSPTSIDVFDAYIENDGKRIQYIECRSLIDQWKIPSLMTIENCNLFLLTHYSAAGDRDNLIKMISNVSVDHGVSASDDGMSTAITVKQGAASFKKAKIQNPIKLSPLRVFPEIDMEPTPHVIRVDSKDLSILLRESEGGLWEQQAVEQIREYLKANLKEKSTLIA